MCRARVLPADEGRRLFGCRRGGPTPSPLRRSNPHSRSDRTLLAASQSHRVAGVLRGHGHSPSHPPEASDFEGLRHQSWLVPFVRRDRQVSIKSGYRARDRSLDSTDRHHSNSQFAEHWKRLRHRHSLRTRRASRLSPHGNRYRQGNAELIAAGTFTTLFLTLPSPC
jgi:hypothetical protein